MHHTNFARRQITGKLASNDPKILAMSPKKNHKTIHTITTGKRRNAANFSKLLITGDMV